MLDLDAKINDLIIDPEFLADVSQLKNADTNDWCTVQALLDKFGISLEVLNHISHAMYSTKFHRFGNYVSRLVG